MSAYHLTPSAVEDLEGIYHFIAQDNPAMAIRFIDILEEECKILAQSPKIGRMREELAQNLRSFPVGDYIIFYRPIQNSIHIIRVLHSTRDILNIF